MKSCDEARQNIEVPREVEIASYYKLREHLNQMGEQFQKFLTEPKYIVPFLQPGRLIKVFLSSKLSFQYLILLALGQESWPWIWLGSCSQLRSQKEGAGQKEEGWKPSSNTRLWSRRSPSRWESSRLGQHWAHSRQGRIPWLHGGCSNPSLCHPKDQLCPTLSPQGFEGHS